MAHSFRELGSFGFSTPDLEPVRLASGPPETNSPDPAKISVAISMLDSIISFNFQHFFLLVLSIFFFFPSKLVATVLNLFTLFTLEVLTLSFSLRKYQTNLLVSTLDTFAINFFFSKLVATVLNL